MASGDIVLSANGVRLRKYSADLMGTNVDHQNSVLAAAAIESASLVLTVEQNTNLSGVLSPLTFDPSKTYNVAFTEV